MKFDERSSGFKSDLEPWLAVRTNRHPKGAIRCIQVVQKRQMQQLNIWFSELCVDTSSLCKDYSVLKSNSGTNSWCCWHSVCAVPAVAAWLSLISGHARGPRNPACSAAGQNLRSTDRLYGGQMFCSIETRPRSAVQESIQFLSFFLIDFAF
jgi:hypothetical protein